MPAQQRFLDDGRRLIAYAGEVLVRCTRCAAPGRVTAERSGWTWRARFRCTDCGLMLDTDQHHWVGPVRQTGRRPCGYCGHRWLNPIIDYREWPRALAATTKSNCAECGRESEVQLRTERVLGSSDCLDPHFGLPLLLVDEGRHGTLWAYNAAHVQALQTYVSAGLRERGTNAGNGSMFSRLPPWIKAAKNRASVSRRLERVLKFAAVVA